MMEINHWITNHPKKKTQTWKTEGVMYFPLLCDWDANESNSDFKFSSPFWVKALQKKKKNINIWKLILWVCMEEEKKMKLPGCWKISRISGRRLSVTHWFDYMIALRWDFYILSSSSDLGTEFVWLITRDRGFVWIYYYIGLNAFFTPNFFMIVWFWSYKFRLFDFNPLILMMWQFVCSST